MALFIKPDIRYTDMAIYIDTYLYKQPQTDEIKSTIYEYLYHLIQMLSFKAGFFETYCEYESFSIYAATKVFERLYNPKNRTSKKPIKSILNFLKKTIYYIKVDYLKEQCVDRETNDDQIIPIYSFKEKLIETSNPIDNIEFIESLSNLSGIIIKFFSSRKLLYNEDMYENIQISCLLTLSNLITLSTKDKRTLDKLSTLSGKHFNKIQQQYSLSPKDIVLFNLPELYRDLILILLKELLSIIAENLSFQSHYQIYYSDVLEMLLNEDRFTYANKR